MKSKFKFLPLLLLFCFLITGCGGGNSKDELVSELMYGAKLGMTMKNVSDLLDKKGIEVQYESASDGDILNVDDTILDYCENYATSIMQYSFIDNTLNNTIAIVSEKDITKIKEKIITVLGEPTRTHDTGTLVWVCDDFRIIIGGDSAGYVIQVIASDNSEVSSDGSSVFESQSDSKNKDVTINTIKLEKEYDYTQSCQLYFDVNKDEVTSIMQVNYYHSSLWTDDENEDFDNITYSRQELCGIIDGVDYYLQKKNGLYIETLCYDVKNHLSDIKNSTLLPFDIDITQDHLSLANIENNLLNDNWEIIE